MSMSLGLRVRGPHRRVDLLVRPPAERRLAAPQLHQERGHCEDVGRRCQLSSVDLLGRHVTRRAEDTVSARRRGPGRGDAEVDDLDLPLFVHHHVARRHVAVHDVHPAVRVVERAADLDAHVRALLRREALSCPDLAPPGGAPPCSRPRRTPSRGSTSRARRRARRPARCSGARGRRWSSPPRRSGARTRRRTRARRGSA